MHRQKRWHPHTEQSQCPNSAVRAIQTNLTPTIPVNEGGALLRNRGCRFHLQASPLGMQRKLIHVQQLRSCYLPSQVFTGQCLKCTTCLFMFSLKRDTSQLYRALPSVRDNFFLRRRGGFSFPECLIVSELPFRSIKERSTVGRIWIFKYTVAEVLISLNSILLMLFRYYYRSQFY